MQVTSRDGLLDHIWADALASLRALGRHTPSQPSSPTPGQRDATVSGASGHAHSEAGDAYGARGSGAHDWSAPHVQERCVRSMAELKAVVLQLQVCACLLATSN